ncbi:MAG TPA: adenylate kinase [Chloroflexota bacterium]|nr:adenylate kinase [Chloroflexota bacterium]
MIIVMLGPPGAGKGTQCQLLAERLLLPHVATGNLLREAVARQTPLGRLAQPYLERGELVPDETMVGLVRERLLEPDAKPGAILDGFPRTVEQARALNHMLFELGRKVDQVLYLRIPVEVVLDRIAGRYTCPCCGATYHLTSSPPKVAGRCDRCGAALIQRTDDRRDVALRRMQVYAAQTAPVVTFYREEGVLVEIDGAQPVERVLDDELEALESSALIPDPESTEATWQHS